MSSPLDLLNPLALIRAANALLGPIAPGLSAAFAERLFTRPRRHVPPEREAAAEASGRRVELGAGRSALCFGVGGGPRILVIHGWEGRATQWGAFADMAVRAGFEVLAVEPPGHGRSQGRTAHPASFAGALLEADRRYGPFVAVVGHSMGGAAATLAVSSGLRTERIVTIASPSSTVGVLQRFSRHVGLVAAAERRLFDRMEEVVGHAAEDLDVAALALRRPTLVIHSRDDREIPFADAEAIASGWPNAELLALDELGHRRILRDPAVIEAVIEFIARGRELARTG
jgi:pimeloyl-ACP methyl ester carboxylesterase